MEYLHIIDNSYDFQNPPVISPRYSEVSSDAGKQWMSRDMSVSCCESV